MINEPILDGQTQTLFNSTDHVLRPGNRNCGGCGMSNFLQMLRLAVGNRQIQLAIPPCCGVVALGAYPETTFGFPSVFSTFAAGSAVATGLSVVAALNEENTRTICFAGDGGTYDIGIASLSAAAERNEDILYICYDNEIYGNTGGQRSSATPEGATTTNLSGGKEEAKKDIMAIVAAHRIPYAATISLAHVDDTLRKLRLALDMKGFRFLHVLAPCPTGWKSEPALGIELVRLAVLSGVFPIYEVFDGKRYKINFEPTLLIGDIDRYLSLQGRFKKSGINADDLFPAIRENWQLLRHLSAAV